jgi:RNA 3'-terminal phosphate cyclase (ATP)
MLHIDGTMGGGQILRTSLSLGMILKKSFVIDRIRSNRPKPGLQAQHLACVDAVAKIAQSAAVIDGNQLNSTYVTFSYQGNGESYPPARDELFRIGTAGSSMLLLQTILPIYLFACKEPSTFVIEGGTHNNLAPSSTFIEETFLPILHRLGVQIKVVTERVGLMPEGNGRVRVRIEPILDVTTLSSFHSIHPKSCGKVSAILFHKQHNAAILPITHPARFQPTLGDIEIEARSCGSSRKPAYAICLTVPSQDGAMVLTSSDFKQNIDKILRSAQEQLQTYLASSWFVDEYLSDQLLLYIALGLNFTYRVEMFSEHFVTNKQVIEQFYGQEMIALSEEKIVSPVTR